MFWRLSAVVQRLQRPPYWPVAVHNPTRTSTNSGWTYLVDAKNHNRQREDNRLNRKTGSQTWTMDVHFENWFLISGLLVFLYRIFITAVIQFQMSIAQKIVYVIQKWTSVVQQTSAYIHSWESAATRRRERHFKMDVFRFNSCTTLRVLALSDTDAREFRITALYV